MSQKEFTMKPIIKEDIEKKEAALEVTVPAVQQTGQSHVPQEPQSIESASSPEQRDIADIKKDILHYWHQAEQSYLEVGRLLIEARKQVPHGSWLKWLNDNTEISIVKAQRLIRLAEEFASNTSPVTHLGYSKASVLLTLHKTERESFVEETHDVGGTPKNVSDMSKRELEKVVRERKKSKSPDDPAKYQNSTNVQESGATEGGEPTERANPDPVSFLLNQVVHLEHIIDDVLGILANQVDNAEEQEELVSMLRRICDKALRELPPEKMIEETLSA